MAGDFGAQATLSVELEPGAAASVRQELEGELSDIGVGGGAAGALGGGGSPVTDGGIDAVASELSDQTDILEDLLKEVETGGVGGGGGGGGGLPSIIPLGGLGGGGSGGGGLFARALSFLGRRAAPTALATGQLGRGGVVDPDGDFTGEFDGPFGQLRAAGEGVGRVGDTAGSFFSAFTSLPDAPTSAELPGNITRRTIRENRRQGNTPFTSAESTGPSRQNRAAQQRGGRGDTNIDLTVNVERVQQELEQALRDAKRQAAREVAQEVNQNIAGTSSRTGL